MKVIRVVATEEGESRFTVFDIPLPAKDISGHTLHASDGFVSPNVRIVEFPAGGESGWHGASARQLVFVVSGIMEVEIGDGGEKTVACGRHLYRR